MSDRANIVILLHPGQDVQEWRCRYDRGLTFDRTPYGYDRADRWFDLAWGQTRPGSWPAQLLTRWSTRLLGCDLPHAWRNRKLIRRADVVWTHTEREHLAIALLQLPCRRSRRTPVVAQSVWLWDQWPGFGSMRKWLLSRLLRTHSVELVLSRLNLEDSRAAVPGRRVELVPFGTAPAVIEAPDRRAPQLASDRRPLVLAVGNDADRDWDLFAAVTRELPDIQFRIASKSKAARAVAWPENVSLQEAKSVEELRDLYLKADVVALPLRPNRHASGATVCIEALAARSRIVSTRAGGIEDYLGGEGRLVEPGDVAGFAEAVLSGVNREFAQPSPDAYVTNGLTQADYIGRYVLVTRAVLGDGPWGGEISAFAPVGLIEEGR